MGFLGVGLLRFVFAHERRIARPELGFDDTMNIPDGLGLNGHAIGSHVSDKADGFTADINALVKPLRDLHGLLGGKTKLARGVHLQRRGAERRVGIALGGFLF